MRRLLLAVALLSSRPAHSQPAPAWDAPLLDAAARPRSIIEALEPPPSFPASRNRSQYDWLTSRNPHPKERFAIAVIGDVEPGRFAWERFFSPGADAFRLQLKDMQSGSPDLIFQLGDLVSLGTPELFAEMLAFLSRESTVPFFSVIGNHDRSAPNGPADKSEYRRVFGDTDFFFDYNGWRFIGLDSSDRRLTSEQLRWLARTLRTPQRKLIFMHVPPAFLMGKFNPGGVEPMQTKLRPLPQDYWDDVLTAYFVPGSAEFEELVTEAKVDRVYMGHIHAFAAAMHRGVGYVLTGGGGSPLYPLPPSFPQRMMAHTIRVELGPDGARETVRVLSGETFPLFP